MTWATGCFVILTGVVCGQKVVIGVRVLGADGRASNEVQLDVSRSDGDECTCFAKLVPDAEGRTELPLPVEDLSNLLRQYVCLWAAMPGKTLAFANVNCFEPPIERGLMLQLPDSAGCRLQVLAPDGAPVPSARVTLAMFGASSRAPVPDEIAERMAVTTDAAGRCLLPVAKAEDARRIVVLHPEHGEQSFLFIREWNGSDPLKLFATVTLQGIVRTSEVVDLAGRKVEIRARFEHGESDPIRQEFRAVVHLDADGRFTARAVPGSNDVVLAPCEGFPHSAAGQFVAEADRPALIELDLGPAIEIAGRVTEKGSAAPIEGLKVQVQCASGQVRSVVTGIDGSFQASIWPGSFFCSIPRIPSPWLYGGSRGVPIDAVQGRQLAPIAIELPRGSTVSGEVTDPGGAPIGGVWVQGRHADSNQDPWPRNVLSADDGTYVLEGLLPDQPVVLTAKTADLVMEAPLTVESGSRDVDIVIAPRSLARPSGRVVDETGRPFAGAEVRLFVRSRDDRGYVRVLEQRTIRTGADGEFEAPEPVEIKHEFRAVARADGREVCTSSWHRLDGDRPGRLEDLTLRALRTVSGRVVDPGKVPLEGVEVFERGIAGAPKRTTTDAQGRFTLSGLFPEPSVLLARRDGFRMRGTWVDLSESAQAVKTKAGTRDTSGTSFEILLVRDGEHAVPRSTLPLGITPAQVEAWCGELLEPFVAAAIEAPDKGESSRIFSALAEAQPARMLEIIEKGVIAEAWFRDYYRRPIARRWFVDSFEDGLSLVNAFDTAQFRCRGLLDAFEARPDLDAQTRKAILNEAVAQARGEQHPSYRVLWLGNIAEAFFDLGDVETCRALLDEALPLVRQLGREEWEAYARGAFAEELAATDLDAALELVREIKDIRERWRHLGNIAHELAGRDPGRAREVLAGIEDEWRRSQITQRVCYRMARVDPDAAAELARTIDNSLQQAYALGLMAFAVAFEDIDRAHTWIEQAYSLLEAPGKRDELSNAWNCPAALAAWMLSFVEAIDPALVEDHLWRVLALLPGRDPWSAEASVTRRQRDASTALYVARYDRDAARHLLHRIEPAFDALLEESNDEARAAVMTAALLDQTFLLQKLEKLRQSGNTFLSILASDAASFLSRSDAERWNAAQKPVLSLWVPDEEDG